MSLPRAERTLEKFVLQPKHRLFQGYVEDVSDEPKSTDVLVDIDFRDGKRYNAPHGPLAVDAFGRELVRALDAYVRVAETEVLALEPGVSKRHPKLLLGCAAGAGPQDQHRDQVLAVRAAAARARTISAKNSAAAAGRGTGRTTQRVRRPLALTSVITLGKAAALCTSPYTPAQDGALDVARAEGLTPSFAPKAAATRRIPAWSMLLFSQSRPHGGAPWAGPGINIRLHV